jgi:DNA (cytosine-5)-methyltransferase 1
MIQGNLAIRRLTPRECLRLMGLSDKDINKMISVKLSDAALYKLAGNSIVKQVLDALHINMFILNKEYYK